MTDSAVYCLTHRDARHNAANAVMEAPAGYFVTIKEGSLSQKQGAKFHAICSDLEKSGLVFAGKPRTKAEWKVILISGHAVATKQEYELIEGIEGELVNVRETMSTMGKSRTSSLVEYSQAFAAENCVVLAA